MIKNIMLKVAKKIVEDALNVQISRKSSGNKLTHLVFSDYQSALSACPQSTGYEISDLVEVIFEKTKRYVNAIENKPIEINASQSFSLNILQNLEQKKSSISVLDFGGACGAHYFLLRKLLDKKIRLDWNVVETPLMAKKAATLETSELKFFDSIKDATQNGKAFDLVYTSSTLQYTSKPYEILNELISLGASHLAFLRGALTSGITDDIKIQSSLLSKNGPGSMPESFEECELFFPITYIQKKKFEEALAGAGYRLEMTLNSSTSFLHDSYVEFNGVFVRS